MITELDIIMDIQKFRKKLYKTKKEIEKMRASKRKTKLLQHIAHLEKRVAQSMNEKWKSNLKWGFWCAFILAGFTWIGYWIGKLFE